ncbi:aggregation factor core protein MAFp3, isoform C [Tateyamaria sp.]|nr:aggregation factor core protein MAFp3, isoform C [Tateyamaria sp.]
MRDTLRLWKFAIAPVILITLGVSAANADITVTFKDGAPKDRFTIVLNAACAIGPSVLQINLATAPVGLLFDITENGDGIGVSQPFEWVSPPNNLAATPQVVDGDTILELNLNGLSPEVPWVFTIDLDDKASNQPITVSGSEIAGAQAILLTSGRSTTGIFDASGEATISTVCS